MSSFDRPPNLELDSFDDDAHRWNSGDRVFAPREPGWHYPGTIGEIKDASAFLYFDDGKQDWAALGHLLPVELIPGQQVFCRSRDHQKYDPATIKLCKGDQLQLEYNDGDTVWTVVAMICVYHKPANAPDLPRHAIRHPKDQASPRPGPAAIVPPPPAEYPPPPPSVPRLEPDHAREQWRVGDRVLAQRDGGWLYTGTIREVHGREVLIFFDQGGQVWIHEGDVQPLDIDVGSRVFCRWMGGAVYYSGTVKDRRGETIYIHYDDGDKEWNSLGMIRIPGDSVTATLGSLQTIFFGRWGCLVWLLIIGAVIFFINRFF